MAGELQHYASAVGYPGSGCVAAVADCADVSSGKRGVGIRVLFTNAGMHHPDCGYCDVPIRDAIQHDA
ncbi:hypothetical protein D3C85_1450730 [compost metagenome]